MTRRANPKEVGRAIQLAKVAHAGQADKQGQPYRLHLERVANRLQASEGKITAWLHDTIEDTPVTLAQLRECEFPSEVIGAVDTLTRRAGETYFHYIERVRSNGSKLAVQVKIADLQDHLDDTRAIPTSLVARYRKALRMLEES